MIVCRERIEIGADVQMSPNVQIYDHDHDFRVPGGVKAGKYRTAPVKIGNNVLIAPGAFVNFDVPDNSIVLGNPGQIIPRKESPTKAYIVFPVE